MEQTKVIIGIPGTWKDRTELIQAVALKSGGYLMAGFLLHHFEKNVSFEAELYGHDPRLAEAFNYASADSMPEEVFREIAAHTFTIYLVGNIQTMEDAWELVDAGAAILQAGGTAVKIETSGLAHSKASWLERQTERELSDLYTVFVTMVEEEGNVYSCGMKALLLPDTVVENAAAEEETIQAIHSFNLYQLYEKPDLASGQTFSPDADSPVYTLTKAKDDRYGEDDLFHNPHGLWRLRIAENV